MKVFAFLLLFVLCLSAATEGHTLSIVPQPQSVTRLPGSFTLTRQTAIDVDTPLADDAQAYLQQQLSLNAHYRLTRQQRRSDTIDYRLDKQLPHEAYRLQIRPRQIEIRASSRAGFFYATVSLMQLMEPTIWGMEKRSDAIQKWHLPACSISDAPRFKWRGMMLDSARNFFSVDYVKKFIDRMAQHKLNLFHWHLSDDEGWRIEIKKYPRLTDVGSRRGPGTALPFSLYPTMRGTKEKVQEGFYTQEEIREVVAYAARRSVRVLPEVDLPAHSKAAVMSYPELLLDPDDSSDYRSVQKVRNNTMDPGLESTYIFVDDIVRELVTLFPFEYIHLGGDEVPKGAWQGSPSVKRLMHREQLTDNKEVQAYFFNQVDQILKKYHRSLIAWQEVRRDKSTLREATIIMAWRGDGAGIKAAKAGQNVVMAPAQFLYFDQQYVKSKKEYGHTWAGPTDTKEVYSYEPLSKGLSVRGQEAVKGVHGALWSERAPTEQIADYLAWPRMLALSEVAWTQAERREWEDFKTRAFGAALQRLKEQKVYYRTPTAP